MTIRELLSENTNIGRERSGVYLTVVVESDHRFTNIVYANKLCSEIEGFWDKEVKNWFLCFDQQDIDVIELNISV